MSNAATLPPDLPTLADLGHDLLKTTPTQRFWAISRPFMCVAAYMVFAALGWWPLAVLSVMLLFIAIVASAHDLVHQVLGLPRRVNEVFLCLIGLLVLESGHAYKVSHLQHHRRFPFEDDPEGDPARMGFWRAILEGPFFLFRLWVWAWRNAPHERQWLAFEAAWFFGFILAAILLWPVAPGLLVYAGLVIAGSWVYPLSTVHLPHNAQEENALFHTYTLRGRIVPALFLELTYHLEHHLYPGVPSHHYAELSRRLEPYLTSHGVKPIQVW